MTGLRPLPLPPPFTRTPRRAAVVRRRPHAGALEVLDHTLLELNVPTIQAMTGGWPWLAPPRRVVVPVARRIPARRRAHPVLLWPTMDTRRLAALAAAAPALDRLAAGLYGYAHPCRTGQPPDGRPPLRVAPGRRARWRVDLPGAATAFAAAATTALPATLPWDASLTATATAALTSLPATATAPLTTLQATVDGRRVWRSHAAPSALRTLHTLCVSTGSAPSTPSTWRRWRASPARRFPPSPPPSRLGSSTRPRRGWWRGRGSPRPPRPCPRSPSWTRLEAALPAAPVDAALAALARPCSAWRGWWSTRVRHQTTNGRCMR